MKTAETKDKLSYPRTVRCDHVDDYHGTKVPDPYRWLEDPNSPETCAWVESQNAVTKPFLQGLPHYRAIKQRLTKLWDHERRGLPWQEGERFFWYHNSGLQNQSVLYTANDVQSANPRALLDPNILSEDGTVALNAASVSEDGNLLAYAISKSGSDWQEWRVRNVTTGEDLPDVVQWSKFSGASWTKDNKGFLYSRYDEPDKETKLKNENKNHKVYYHLLGSEQSEDRLIYERPDQPGWLFNSEFTEDGRFLILQASEGFDSNRVWFAEMSGKGMSDEPFVFTELFNKDDAHYSVVDNNGSMFWVVTDRDAPRQKLVAVDSQKAAAGDPALIELIPEAADTLESVSVLDNKFVVSYLHHAHTKVRIFDLDGTFQRDVQFPGLGTVTGFRGKRAQHVTYYWFTSFNSPGCGYRHNMRTEETELFYQPKIEIDASKFHSEQVFFESKDGTRIPMFVCHRKDLKKDGSNPTYLLGYGGFAISYTPFFSLSNALWMEMGGILAVANLRGGGEYGEDWHQAGTKLKKQNVFDDFIAAAEWLIANDYTKPEKLGIAGGSNGGLLVGACMTQRPDLFAAAMPAVGVLDMLRFHNFTIGAHWTTDYGSSDDAEQFKVLLSYSPVHNVKDGLHYPATLVTTADHDDRVVPAHSYKFIAALQNAHQGDAPVLINIETKAGHGAGKPTTKVIESITDQWAFLLHALDHEPKSLDASTE